MKRKYEKPMIIDFHNLTSQALGQTTCGPHGVGASVSCNEGSSAIGTCGTGNAANGDCHTGNSASGFNCIEGGSAVAICNPGGSAASHGDNILESCSSGQTPGNEVLCMLGNAENSSARFRHEKNERKVGIGNCELGAAASTCFTGQEPGIENHCAGGASPLDDSCRSGYEAGPLGTGCQHGGMPGTGVCKQGFDNCGNGNYDNDDSNCFNGSFAGPEDCNTGGKNLMEGCLTGFGEEGCVSGGNPYNTPCVSGGFDCNSGYSAV